MTDFSNLLYALDDGIARITFNRPAALNALDEATLNELAAAIDRATADGARALLLTGSGKAFVAGADIASMHKKSAPDADRFAKLGNHLFRRIEKLDIPTIAAVNGFALGGGCELAMACDFIYASDRAKFGQPEVALGLIAGFGGTQRLPRKVGTPMAMELLLSGRMIDAAEALRIGLANRVVSGDELLDAAEATLREILSKGPIAVRLTKQLVRSALDTPIDDGLEREIAEFGAIFSSTDCREGMGAFLEKRAAQFKGE
jgi:enoyl-CoA hydratase